jgi:PTS system glucitol/sorbitol-specific IIA component
VATANLKQLGHITLNFDGAATLNYRGWYIFVATTTNIQRGDQISFIVIKT